MCCGVPRDHLQVGCETSTNSQAENYFSQGIRNRIKTTDFYFIICFEGAYILIFSSHSTELYLNVDLQLLTIFITSSKYSSSDIEQKKYLFPLICRYEMQFSVSAKYIFKFPLEYFRGVEVHLYQLCYIFHTDFSSIYREGKLKVCIHEQACHVPVVLLYKHGSQRDAHFCPIK